MSSNRKHNKKVLVIGAGITGLMAAYSLARRGIKVEIIEQERYPAMRTSFANGGQFSVSNADTWNTWHNVFKGLKWMLKKDAPLLVRPMPTLSKLDWIAGFIKNTVNNSWTTNTSNTIKMALQARKLYKEIAQRENIQFDHSQRGILHFYKDSRSFKAAQELTKFYINENVDRRVLTAQEVVSIEPTLSGAKGIIGGTYTPDDGMGDIHKFCTSMARILVDTYAVNIHYGAKVVELMDEIDHILVVTKENDEDVTRSYSEIVISAGAESSKLAWMLRENTNVYPVKGYSITIPLDEPLHAPSTSLLDDDAKIVTSTLGNRLRVAGTAELDGWNRDIRIDRIDPLHRWVHANLPQISTKDAVPWAGLRPMTYNMMPIVRQCTTNNKVWWHSGHGHLGWTLSAATAEILADLMCASEIV